jgi:hypothetical protein
MNRRNWILRLTTAFLLIVAGFSIFAATDSYSSSSKLTSSIPSITSQTPTLTDSNQLSNISNTSTPDNSNVYVDQPNDYSIKYLSMLFGHVGNTLNGSLSGQTIGKLFYIFNQGILIACGIWVLLTLVRILGKMIDGNIQEISKEGKSFLSICLGIVLVIPSPTTGYSTIQNIIMKVVVQGVKLANGIWNYQIDAFENHTHVFDNPPQQSTWTNSSEENKPEYTYNDIMTNQIPLKINSEFYNMLNAEINYYQSEIRCKNDGSCGDSPQPLIADQQLSDISSVTLNQSYATGGGDKGPITFTAQLKPDVSNQGTTNTDSLSGKTPFNEQLRNAADTLKETAKSFACQSYPESDFCSGVAPVDLANSANLIIGLSTSFSETITNVYSLDKLAADNTTDNDHIDNSTNKTCLARWQKDGESPHYDEAELAKYNEAMADYEAKKEAVANKLSQLKESDLYKKYNDDSRYENYQHLMDGSCSIDSIYCTIPGKDYMGIGEVGAWGREDLLANSPPMSYQDTVSTCAIYITQGRSREDAGFLSNNVGKALYPNLSIHDATTLCENYGSILYQAWRDQDALTQSDKDALVNLLPTQEEIAGITPPIHPKAIEDYDTTDAQTCTKVLADKMRSSGWIMAGSYYWLIAHQDQVMVTQKSSTSENFLDYSVGRKTHDALAAFLFIGGDNNDSGGSTPSCQANTDGATVTNLKNCVALNIQEAFRDNGANIGQIDTLDSSDSGISAQLAWAGNAFNAIISSETESIGAAPGANSTSNDTAAMAKNDNNLGRYGKSFLGGFYQAQSALYPQLLNQIYFLQKFILNVASQLNNPNLDPQSIIASIGMGMIYQGGYATLGYIHMMISLVITALIGIIAVALLMLIPVAGASLAIIGGGAIAILVSFVKIMGGILKKIGVTFMTMGAVMAFYVPIYPWIVFTFAAVGWFIAVIEAMAAGPLICLGMTNPQGHELANSLKQSIMLLLSIFIRPALMIISFILSMILARVLLFFMIQGFLMLLGTLYDGNSNDYCRYIFNHASSGSKAVCDGGYGSNVNLWSSMFNLSSHASDIANEQYASTISPVTTNVADTSAGALDSSIPLAYQTKTTLDGRPNADGYQSIMQFIMMMLSMPIMLGLLTYMTYKIINHAYSLVFIVPENVLKWIGAQAAGDTRNIMQSVEGSKGSATKSAQSAAKGGEKAMSGGEAQATGVMKAGGSTGAKVTGEISSKIAKGKE